jgi:hypothetical protein
MDEEMCERIVASAVKFLIDGDDHEAALALLPCSLSLHHQYYDGPNTVMTVVLSGPRASYNALYQRDDDYDRFANEMRERVRDAVIAHLPFGTACGEYIVRPALITPDPSWRTEAARAAGGKQVRNQAPDIEGGKIVTWNYLRFRSETEKRIAAALDATRVLFFPNCVGRLNVGDGRGNREPDFLVCDRGRWGILEIDGDIFHPSAAKDHDRDRLFEAYGIKAIERYPWQRCYDDPNGVVRNFLELLAING